MNKARILTKIKATNTSTKFIDIANVGASKELVMHFNIVTKKVVKQIGHKETHKLHHRLWLGHLDE